MLLWFTRCILWGMYHMLALQHIVVLLWRLIYVCIKKNKKHEYHTRWRRITTCVVLVKNSGLATCGCWQIERCGWIFGGGTLTWWWVCKLIFGGCKEYGAICCFKSWTSFLYSAKQLSMIIYNLKRWVMESSFLGANLT